MRFVIMADGKGTRWNNYMGVPKHLVSIDGEPIIAHTIRLLSELTDSGSEIIVTSHDARYEFEGARRHEPQNNIYEIDRFTAELVEDDMCFLYGDTIYTFEVLCEIIEAETEDMLFFGNNKSVVAVKVKDSTVFRKHFDYVREQYLEGNISKCKGWQLYQSFVGQDMNSSPVPDKKFIYVSDRTTDINTPDEYERSAGK